MNELNAYRAVKDSKMKGNEGSPPNEADRYAKDNFGGMNGIDPNSHGAELQ